MARLRARLALRTHRCYAFDVTTSEEIEAALHRLPIEERWNLLCRFSDELWSDWDGQIETDLSAGKLDGLLAEARADIAEGRTHSLDEILDHRKIPGGLCTASLRSSAVRTQAILFVAAKSPPPFGAI